MMSDQSGFQDDVPEQSSTGQYRLYFLDLPAISGVRYRQATESGTA